MKKLFDKLCVGVLYSAIAVASAAMALALIAGIIITTDKDGGGSEKLL